jgi:hypothetical protein
MTLDESIQGMRLQVIRRASEIGPSAACREAGISRTLVYRWEKRLALYGVDGLHPRRQGARPGPPPQLSPQAERQILAVAIAQATWGCRRLAPPPRRCGEQSRKQFTVHRTRATPLARLDRRRQKRTASAEWVNPSDPDAKVTQMKDGRTHLAHKVEHAVDLETGALVAVTLHGADVGDTTSLLATTLTAAEQLAAVQAPVPTALVGDRGYHSNDTLLTLRRLGIRAYVAEPDRGRRCWAQEPDAQQPVYGNHRRVGGPRGKRWMRRRGEYVERTFAHVYDTGGLRRVHLRGHPNILKRLIVHAGAFNLGLLMRRVFGRGTPRGLQGRRQLSDLLWLALSSLVAAFQPTLTGRLARGGTPSFALAATGSSQ